MKTSIIGTSLFCALHSVALLCAAGGYERDYEKLVRTCESRRNTLTIQIAKWKSKFYDLPDVNTTLLYGMKDVARKYFEIAQKVFELETEKRKVVEDVTEYKICQHAALGLLALSSVHVVQERPQILVTLRRAGTKRLREGELDLRRSDDIMKHGHT